MKIADLASYINVNDDSNRPHTADQWLVLAAIGAVIIIVLAILDSRR